MPTRTCFAPAAACLRETASPTGRSPRWSASGCGIAEETSTEEATAKLDAGLDRWIASPTDREFLVPRLGALLGVAEPGLARDELFAGWRMFFERLAEQDPVVMVFEDLQWAGDGLLDFIEHLLEWSTQHAIFMLGFARSELAERRDGWPGGRRGATLIHLEPLPDEAMGMLLDGLVDGLPAEARARIVSQAEGIPLYAIETVRALADRGVLVEGVNRLELGGEIGELDIPASLSSLLAARLDALESEERELVRTMSVFGGAFPRASAAALAAVPEESLDPVLDEPRPQAGASDSRRPALSRPRAVRVLPVPAQDGRLRDALAPGAQDAPSRRGRALARGVPEPRRGSGTGDRRTFPRRLRGVGRRSGRRELRAEALAELRRAAHRAETVGAPEMAEQASRTAADLATDDQERLALLEAAGLMARLAARWDDALAASRGGRRGP